MTRRGMTLLEVLFALAILVVLSVGVGAFFFRMTDQRDQLVRLAGQQRDVALLLDRLESALLSAVAVAPDGSAGVSGDGTSLSIAARGVHPGLDQAAALADSAVLTFAFVESSGTCTQTLSVDGADAVSEPIAAHIERLRFRYSDGRDWSTSFESLEAGGLPVAVEVSVWLEPRSPRARPEPAPSFPGEDPMSGLPDPLEERLGPMDLPPDEPERPSWTPREPDHLRVIGIPDAPDWKERQS